MGSDGDDARVAHCVRVGGPRAELALVLMLMLCGVVKPNPAEKETLTRYVSRTVYTTEPTI